MDSRMLKILGTCILAVIIVLAVSAISFGAAAGQGAAVYQQFCASCHGVDGAYKNLPGRSASDIIQKTRSGAGGMPSYDSSVISDAELNDMATYVTTNLDATDNTDPTIDSISPSGTINTDSATIVVYYSDNSSGWGIDESTAIISLDGSPLTGCDITWASATCEVFGLGNSLHSVSVTVDDYAGNTGSGNGSFTVDWSSDPTDPVISSIEPGGTIMNANASLIVYYSDSESGIDTGTVAITLDGSAVSGCTVTTSYASCSVTGLSSGGHTIAVSVDDNNGNQATGSGSFTLDYSSDTTNPSVSNVLPGGTISTDSTTITADYSDTESGIDSASVVVYLDGSAISGCTAGGSSVSCSVTGLGEGGHTIDVNVDDNAGNSGAGNGSFTVDTTIPPCTTKFTDINGATVAVYSDSSYSAAVCQYDTLSPNTVYYMQLEHPTMNLNSNGTNRNELRLTNLADSNVNFGDGTGTETFTQQAGGPPYVYRASFETPGTADAYNLAARVEDNSNNEARIRGWSMRVGSAGYLRTFSDSSYSIQTDTYGPSDTVYVEIYSSSLIDSTPNLGQSDLDVADFLNNRSTISFDSVSKPAARTYRMSFTLPGTDGDKAIRMDLRNSGGTRISRPQVVLNISNTETIPPTVSNVLPNVTISTSNTTITADYTDSGSGIDQSTVVVNLDGSPVSGCTVNAGDVSCPVSGLSEGVHAISVSVDDQGGNSGSGSGSFTVDTVDPSVTSVLPSGWVTSADATVIVYYNDGGSGVDTGAVVVNLDGSPISGCSVSGASATCNVYSLSEGAHTITCTVADQAGNQAAINGSFSVDMVNPAVSNVAPSGTTSTDSPTLSADYADGGSGIDQSTVVVNLDGSPVSGCSVGSTSVSCPVSGLTDGVHAITVSVSDNAGITGSGNSTVTVDTGAPLVTSVLPGGTLVTSDATVTVYYNDGGSGVDTGNVTVTLDGSPISGCVIAASSATCNVYSLSDGAHTIGGSVADQAGNNASVSGGFTVDTSGGGDTTPPVINNVQPSGTIGSSSATINAYYSDSGSGIDTASVAVYLDSSPISGCSVGASSVSCTVSGLSDGNHNIAINVSDNDGNPGSGNGSFTVNTSGGDTTPPVVNAVTPSGNGHENSAIIEVYYNDSGSGVNTSAVTVTLDGNPVSGCNTGATKVTCNVTRVVPGTHTIGGSVMDNNGNSASISGSYNVKRSYLWTWYDHLYARNWVLMANPLVATADIDFDLYIGGQQKDLSGYNNGLVPAGQSIAPIFPGLIDGPVLTSIDDGSKAIVSQRTIWAQNSFEEVLGVDSQKLSNHFYWTWYDQQSPTYRNWVLIGNNNPYAVYYEVRIAGQSMATGSIAPGGSATPQFDGVIGGPVEVEAWSDAVGGSTPADVMASQRVLINNDQAFNEAVGIPADELSNYYLWTWYDSAEAGAENWVMVANPDAAASVYYQIDIAGGCATPGANKACQTGQIGPGGHVAPTFNDISNGPVEVKAWFDSVGGSSPANVIASQRITWGQSFGEVMGYPYDDLNPSYHWTWYDQLSPGMSNWVLVANPSTTETIKVEVWINGNQMHEDNDPGKPDVWTLAPGERVAPSFNGFMDGPVETRGYVDGGDWSNSSQRRNIMASQRVLYNGFFNEVLGIVLD